MTAHDRRLLSGQLPPFHCSSPTLPPVTAQRSASEARIKNSTANKLALEDRAFHDWYRFVLSYPPHLVREYRDSFGLTSTSMVLDPFCGCGTTLVECKRIGIRSIGIEANPFAHFASTTKLDWRPNPARMKDAADRIAACAREILSRDGLSDEVSQQILVPSDLRTFDAEQSRLVLKDSISPIPLHRALVLLDAIHQDALREGKAHLLLAFAKMVVFQASNLHFGPEVGVGKIKVDAPVIELWLSEVRALADDLSSAAGNPVSEGKALLGDARNPGANISPNSIDAVITSPPYPNEKDYTRTTRLESVLLGHMRDKAGLRMLKQNLLRSNTRNVYKGDNDDQWIRHHAVIQRIADEIEARRIALGKDSGFEKMYARVTKLYFGGMAKHLAELRPLLKPGAQLAYVVGDQASYLRVMIRTGEILSEIAGALGYKTERIDLFRTRFSTATREQLREEVLVLRWPGTK